MGDTITKERDQIILDLKKKGYSPRIIGKIMNISHTTVYGILKAVDKSEV